MAGGVTLEFTEYDGWLIGAPYPVKSMSVRKAFRKIATLGSSAVHEAFFGLTKGIIQ